MYIRVLGLVRHQQQANQHLSLVNCTPHVIIMFAKKADKHKLSEYFSHLLQVILYIYEIRGTSENFKNLSHPLFRPRSVHFFNFLNLSRDQVSF
jgi:hypothetical protein